MNIINRTPYPLTIYFPGGSISVEPTEPTTYVEDKFIDGIPVEGIPLTLVTYGETVNLPPRRPGTIYVVSGLVEARNPREDIYAPGKWIRDHRGEKIGCAGLKQTREI